MKELFKSIQIVHLALLIGSLLFFLIALFLAGFKISMDFQEHALFSYLPLGLVPLMIFMSRFMYKQLLNGFAETDDLKEKLTFYRNAIIVRSAMLEGALLFTATVLFLELPNVYVVALFAIGWLALLQARPTLEELARDFGLSSQEQDEIMRG